MSRKALLGWIGAQSLKAIGERLFKHDRLERGRAGWKHAQNYDNRRVMNDESQNGPSQASAGGFFIAIGVILGAILGGAIFGQPSAGLLVGLGLGILIAVVIWLRGRAR